MTNAGKRQVTDGKREDKTDLGVINKKLDEWLLVSRTGIALAEDVVVVGDRDVKQVTLTTLQASFARLRLVARPRDQLRPSPDSTFLRIYVRRQQRA